MDIRKSDTAVVFIDPQNDVLSEKNAPRPAVTASHKNAPTTAPNNNHDTPG